MPDGQLQWIDSTREVAHIVRRGREFIAPITEVESRARVPGARVHFDIARNGGVEGARNVRLAFGTRTNKRHRRFGDLSGARQPGSKVRTKSAERLGVDVTTQPVRVVEQWVESAADGAIDDLFSLYAPDAVVNTETEAVRGRARLRSFLEDSVPRAFGADAPVVGADQFVRADLPSGPTWFEVDHGRIVEQWFGTEPDMGYSEDSPAPTLEFVTEGPVSERDLEAAQVRFDKLISAVPGNVRFGRLKVSVVDHPSPRPVNASATLDVDGVLLRAHVGTRDVQEACEALCLRLRRQVAQMTDRRKEKAANREAPVDRPDYFQRPPEDRALVRHKSYTTDRSTIEEAVWDMALLDYDFFLFTETGTDQDCLLSAHDGQRHLQCVDGPAPESDWVDVVVESGAPALSVSEAISRLDEGSEPFVFFQNRTTSRGNVLYRRYDGHYGLITPADSPDE